MATALTGRAGWQLERDDDGHRTYTIRWQVKAANPFEGPATVLTTPGIPTIGTPWAIGYDSDPWAMCQPYAKVSMAHNPKEKGIYWWVEQKFSTKALDRCQSTTIDNPLYEPAKLSGSFVKYTKEATHDRHGKPLVTSSHERHRGAEVENDDPRPTVIVGLNILTLPSAYFVPMVGTVNDATLWGVATRCIKLTNCSWERKLYGVCTFYYTVTYEFEIKSDTWDRKLPDMGLKALPAEIGDPPVALDPDATDPRTGKRYRDVPEYFQIIKDDNGENITTPVYLNGKGQRLTDATSPIMTTWELDDESNFLLLGIPSSL